MNIKHFFVDTISKSQLVFINGNHFTANKNPKDLIMSYKNSRGNYFSEYSLVAGYIIFINGSDRLRVRSCRDDRHDVRRIHGHGDVRHGDRKQGFLHRIKSRIIKH